MPSKLTSEVIRPDQYRIGDTLKLPIPQRADGWAQRDASQRRQRIVICRGLGLALATAWKRRAREPSPASQHRDNPTIRPRAVELVIFDCDGVLVDSEPVSNRVLAEMLTAEGLPTTAAEARRDYQGMLLAEIARAAEKKLHRPLPEGWLADFERHRAKAFAQELKPVPGAAEVVKVSAPPAFRCVSPRRGDSPRLA